MALSETQEALLEERIASNRGDTFNVRTVANRIQQLAGFGRLVKQTQIASVLSRATVTTAAPSHPDLFAGLPGIGGGRTPVKKSPTIQVPVKLPRQLLPIDTPVGAPNVSIWSDFVGNLGRTVTGAVNQRISSAINPAQILPGLGALPPLVAAGGRVAGTVGRVLTGRVATAAGLGVALGTTLGNGGGACPSGWHLAKDGSMRCVRNRRMNFGNARAARRAVRRIKGARKLLQDIEKQMPRRPAPRARQHHHHPAAGG